MVDRLSPAERDARRERELATARRLCARLESEVTQCDERIAELEAQRDALLRAWRVLDLGWGEVEGGRPEDVAWAREVREQAFAKAHGEEAKENGT